MNKRKILTLLSSLLLSFTLLVGQDSLVVNAATSQSVEIKHTHIGNSSSNGGCYTIPFYHVHDGSTSKDGACYDPVYHVHSGSTAGGGCYSVVDHYELTCGKTTSTIESYSLTCSKTIDSYSLNCGKEVHSHSGSTAGGGCYSAVSHYELSCGKNGNSVDSYYLSCSKTIDSYYRNCNAEEHSHSGNSSSGGGCYGGKNTCTKTITEAPSASNVANCSSCGQTKVQEIKQTISHNKCGGSTTNTYKQCTCGAMYSGTRQSTGTSTHTYSYYINCGKNEHSHSGNSSSGGGCFGGINYHSHSGNTSSGGACYSPNYHSHTGSSSSGGGCYGKAVYKLGCNKTTSTIENYALICPKNNSTIDYYQLNCNKTEGQKVGQLNVSKSTDDWSSSVTLTASTSNIDSSLLVDSSSFIWNGSASSSNTLTLTDNATVTLKLNVKNNDVNNPTITINVSNIDKTKPIINSVSLSTTDWAESVNILIDAVDNEMGIAGYSIDGTNYQTSSTFTVIENKTYTIYVKDKNNNITTSTIEVNNVDREKPVINSFAKSTDSWTSSLTLTANAQDDGLITGYSYDGGNTWVAENTLNVNSNGSYSVLVKDAFGRISDETQIQVSNIDDIKPIINNVTGNFTEWAKSTSITIDSVDNEMGIKEYSIDDGNTWQSENHFPIAENGIYKIKVKDKNNNIESYANDIEIYNIDTTSPIINNINYDTTSSDLFDVTVTVDAIDLQPDSVDGSGLHSKAYSYDGGQNWTEENSHIFTINGNYKISVRDSLNNISSQDITINNLDVTAPAVSLSKDKNEWTINLNIIVDATDVNSNGSGLGVDLHDTPYSYDGGNTWVAENYYTITENGSYTVKVKDKRNNVASSVIDIDNIDTYNPEILSIAKNTEDYTANFVVLTTTASDAEMGLHDTPYSYDGGNTWVAENTYTVYENKDYTVIVRDKAENQTSQIITVSNIDFDEPVVNGFTKSTNDFTNNPVTLTIDAVDEKMGLHDTPYSYDGGNTWVAENILTVSKSGTYNVLVKDKAENVKSYDMFINNIDLTAPVIKSVDWDKTVDILSTTIIIDAEDLQENGEAGSGLASEAYSWDGGQTWTSDNNLTIDENQSFIIKVKDKFGNTSTKEIVVNSLDNYAPTLSKQQSISTWTNQDIVLTINARDISEFDSTKEGSGLASEAYSWDGGNTWTADNTKTIDRDGTYEVIVKDNCNNTSTRSWNIEIIDKTIPNITLSVDDENWVADKATIIVDANDDSGDTKSGLHDRAYSYDGGNTWVAESFLAVTENGDYTVIVRDKAGNTNSSSITIDNIDVYIPYITSLNLDETELTHENVKITVNAGDDEIGLHEEAYSLDGGFTWKSDNYFIIEESADYTITVRDKAGNTTTQDIRINNIDKTSPTIDKIEWDKEEDLIQTEITIEASDNQFDGSNGCGLADAPYSYDGGQTWTDEGSFIVEDNGEYTILVKDKFGNIIEETIVVDNLDDLEPQFTITQSIEEFTTDDIILNIDACDISEFDSTKEGSGLSDAPYSYDGGDTWVAENSYTITENGDYQIWVRDNANNIAKSVVRISIIDRVGALVSCTYDLGWTQELEITINAYDVGGNNGEDVGIGLHDIPYSWDGGQTWTDEDKFIVRNQGNYTLIARDILLNETKIEFNIMNIDKTAPIFNREITINNIGDSAVVEVFAEDTQSRVKGYTFDGQHYNLDNKTTIYDTVVLTIGATDNVDNVSEFFNVKMIKIVDDYGNVRFIPEGITIDGDGNYIINGDIIINGYDKDGDGNIITGSNEVINPETGKVGHYDNNGNFVPNNYPMDSSNGEIRGNLIILPDGTFIDNENGTAGYFDSNGNRINYTRDHITPDGYIIHPDGTVTTPDGIDGIYQEDGTFISNEELEELARLESENENETSDINTDIEDSDNQENDENLLINNNDGNNNVGGEDSQNSEDITIEEENTSNEVKTFAGGTVEILDEKASLGTLFYQMVTNLNNAEILYHNSVLILKKSLKSPVGKTGIPLVLIYVLLHSLGFGFTSIFKIKGNKKVLAGLAITKGDKDSCKVYIPNFIKNILNKEEMDIKLSKSLIKKFGEKLTKDGKVKNKARILNISLDKNNVIENGIVRKGYIKINK